MMPVRSPRALVLACAAVVLGHALTCAGAWAATAAAVDARQSSIAGGRVVRAVTAVGVVAGPLLDLSLSASRLSDSIVGPGFALGLGVGAGLGPAVEVHASVAHTQWDRSADAWSVSAGPDVRLLGNAIEVRAARTRYADARTVASVGGGLEHTLSARWSARLDASYAHSSDGQSARSFLAGARWTAIGPLSLLGEAGLAHDPFGVLDEGHGAASGPPGVVGGLLNGNPNAQGGSPAAGPSTALHPTAVLGVRCLIP